MTKIILSSFTGAVLCELLQTIPETQITYYNYLSTAYTQFI